MQWSIEELHNVVARADANDLAAVRILEDDGVQARLLVWLARRLMEIEVRNGVDSSPNAMGNA